MNFPQTVNELIHWDTSTGRDTYGTYTIITGFERTGGCFWCGEDLKGQRRRVCGHKKGCWTAYQRHFFWLFARLGCVKRYDYHCANCGVQEILIFKHGYYSHGESNLEVHNIIPLEGSARAMSVFNIPWNLICLCHECHQLIHTIMRPPSKSRLDSFTLAIANGQGVFDILR